MPHKHSPALLFRGVSRQLMRTLIIFTVSTMLGAASPSAQQIRSAFNNHEGWYQVEMIVFTRKDEAGQEHWPRNIKLRYPGNWVELKNPDSGIDFNKDQFYVLPATERTLNSQAQKIQRSGRNEVLFHNAWRQIITNKNNAKAIIITGGQSLGKHQSLAGSIRLSVATYLELQTNLWYAEFENNIGQDINQQWPEIPMPPNKSEMELEQALANDRAQQIGTNGSTASGNNFVTRNIILLQQERDMRSSEIHYIDHPVVGIIIQIKPYSAAATTTVSTQ